MTSFDCVARLRRILHQKKIGHAGTLDPNVDGVLPIALGQATKVIEYLMASGKEYAGELLIGQATTTEDLDGERIAEKPVTAPIEAAVIAAAMQSMTGEQVQIPPMYSAVKVNGRRLYEYARAGETVQRPQRRVTIKTFDLLGTRYDATAQVQRVRFRVQCSKGTYVRTLAVDLARKLGYPGVMTQLTRLAAGGFTLDQTVSLDDLQDLVATSGTIPLFSIDTPLQKFPHQALTAAQWAKVQHGGWLPATAIKEQPATVVLSFDGQVKAIYHQVDQHYQPTKMLATD